MNSPIYDVLIIGAGIAGSSVAAELAKTGKVALVEKELQPGYHASGRSAAMWAPGYGPTSIRALTRASFDFLNSPPEGFSQQSLISKRDVLMIAREDQSNSINKLLAELHGEDIEQISSQQILRRHPLIKNSYVHDGILDSRAYDIDVSTLLQGYLKVLKNYGGQLKTNTEVKQLTRESNFWVAATNKGRLRSKIIVNASGAWANHISNLAGAEEIGLVPKRRTALLIAAPANVIVEQLPMIIDIDEQFYMKPDAGRLLVSPANEDPMPACDVQPEEMDIAQCVDRIENAFDLDICAIDTSWAGLRSFVSDKNPVIGFSSTIEDYFWLCGQGGYGVQSAPAISRLATSMLTNSDFPKDIVNSGLNPNSIAPQRFRAS